MMNVVWLKRDIRLADHQPLSDACRFGETLVLYIAEPSLWNTGDLSRRHFDFILNGLAELAHKLEERGGKLACAVGEVEEVLEQLLHTYGAFSLYTYEEIGPPIIEERDANAARWMGEKGLSYCPYFELPAFQKGWEGKLSRKKWELEMQKPCAQPPGRILSPEIVPERFYSGIERIKGFPVKGDEIRFGQNGGENEAIDTLDSFLKDRCINYIDRHQKPIPSSLSSSRLSPYLSWGNISVKTVYQKTKEAIAGGIEENQTNQQLEAFLSKLYLHHQTILNAMNIPTVFERSIHRAFDSLKDEWDAEFSRRWESGKTGIPIIDATLRCLIQTGWINSSLRTLVVSFASHTLRKDWQRTARELAGLFLDYQPAIHYTQVQKISGTFKDGPIKVHNPIRFGKEVDPDGAFVRRYVPELKDVPDKYIHEPWLYPGFYSLGYPVPVVDAVQANKKINELYRARRQEEKRVRGTPAGKKTEDAEQLYFDL